MRCSFFACHLSGRSVFLFFYTKEKSHMKSGKKITLGFLPILLAVVAMLVTACGGAGSATKAAAAPPGQQNYRIDEPVSDISTFYPALATAPHSSPPTNLSFPALLRQHHPFQLP